LDIALVLQTSGTTARPKTVPLAHANLVASAANISGTLALSEADRCLNVMPLFHIHGLVGALLSSLSRGASVVCTRGFDGFAFAGQLERFRPSWYTAVPTIHQVVLERSRRSDSLARAGLRFVRSSSSALPGPVLEGIEAVSGAPMLEAYGMTEASHQMASNPLPPGRRKPRSVGVGGAVQIAVLGAADAAVAPGERGEVAVRGPNVFAGYHNNPEANAAAFTNGWFRTGDEGVLDGEGYLSLTGRLKELINRGGEKIAPAEVEDVLLRHPAVGEAVVFAVPHRHLGEDVAAAVVLRPGASLEEKAAREYVAGALAEFKVPRRVLFLNALPKGPTGKLQRIGLAARLGLDENGERGG
jgi:acyl-CoA synthetase (AMP-forming)/AMP-acid ligase II